MEVKLKMIAVVYKNKKKNLKCKIITKKLVKYFCFRKKEYSIVNMLCINSTYSKFATKLTLVLNKRAIDKIVKQCEKYNNNLISIGVYKRSVYFEFDKLYMENYLQAIINKKGKIIPINFDNSKKVNDLKKLFGFRYESCIESSKDSILNNLLKADIDWHTNCDNNKLPRFEINPKCLPRRDSQRPDGYKATNEKV